MLESLIEALSVRMINSDFIIVNGVASVKGFDGARVEGLTLLELFMNLTTLCEKKGRNTYTD